jgi:hypothetical protein
MSNPSTDFVLAMFTDTTSHIHPRLLKKPAAAESVSIVTAFITIVPPFLILRDT